MVRVGIVGVGFMGMIHYLAYQRMKGVKVAAMCETDPKKLSGDWRAIKGNFGPPGELMDLSGIAKYETIEAMLADPKLDYVDVCLPPGAHAGVTIAALKAGKHVFCEKPIALTAADAKRMVKTAQDTGKLLLIGHVLPFHAEYLAAYKAISGGKYGKLLGGHFKRIISDPQWLTGFFDPNKVGGPMLDLHVHDAHFIRLACGMPKAVNSVGRMRGEVVEFFTTQFQFADPRLAVTATSGVINQQGRAFTHGFEIHLEKATLLYDLAVIDGKAEVNMPYTVLTADGKVSRPELSAGDAVAPFVAELSEAAKAFKSAKQSSLLDGQLACDAIVLCDKQTQSVRTGKPVKV